MESNDMKRLYLEHREVEEARELDSVVATFDDDCFLENVALSTRASGREAVRKSYEALFATFPDLSPTSVGDAYGDNLFVTWSSGNLSIPSTCRALDVTTFGARPRFPAGSMRSRLVQSLRSAL